VFDIIDARCNHEDSHLTFGRNCDLEMQRYTLPE
jgi:hypothetical protein